MYNQHHTFRRRDAGFDLSPLTLWLNCSFLYLYFVQPTPVSDLTGAQALNTLKPMCYSIYNAPQYPLAGGEGASCPRPQNCTPAIEHFGLNLRPYWPGKSFSTTQSMIFIVVTRYTDKMKRSLQKYDVALKDLRFALISRFRLITTAFC